MIKLYEPKIYQEDIDLVNKTLNDGWISGNSPIVNEFEEKLKIIVMLSIACSLQVERLLYI